MNSNVSVYSHLICCVNDQLPIVPEFFPLKVASLYLSLSRYFFIEAVLPLMLFQI